MAYLVNVTARAERDLADIYAAVDVEHSEAAFRWFNGLERAVLTLEETPARCPMTPEDRDLRHLLYGNKPHIYRVIYRITEKHKQVDVLHIRHGARQAFSPSDLR
jgi:plasmid stabilization system protein ParE